MEAVSVSLYTKMKNYYRRKGYVRLNGSGRRRSNRVELSSPGKRRRFWRIKVTPKLKVKSFAKLSPKRLFIWLRDAYEKTMLGLANSRVFTAGYGGVITDGGISGFGKGPLKEYDEKMIIEIYKSLLIAQGHTVPLPAERFGSAIVSRR